MAILAAPPAWAETHLADADWDEVVEAAEGQTVHFNAWGGDERINAYIDWVGKRLKEKYGVKLRHVKVSDIAETVSRVLAEHEAGEHSGGSTDLMWINGENFATMKKNDLLYGPFASNLPNFKYVDTEDKPTTLVDFTVPTDGLESPWGMAQLVFMYDSARIEQPPRSMEELLAFAKRHPGRVTYPKPPFFLGTTFLKQALHELAADPSVLQDPVGEHDFEKVTAPLWAYLDKLTPHLWRSGNAYPDSGTKMRRMLGDGTLALAFAFNPAAAANDIASGTLPETVRTYVHRGGTVGNTHFVAIPYNAGAKAGAMVTANFLLSPKAQARKADPDIWGDPTVLDVDALPPPARKRFEQLDLHPAVLPPEKRGKTLPEPHPSWVGALEKAWQERYGS